MRGTLNPVCRVGSASRGIRSIGLVRETCHPHVLLLNRCHMYPLNMVAHEWERLSAAIEAFVSTPVQHT
eukprot:m.1237850 g.1237850  ORF g.1237850 m.1237850 type:complete len:69 (-) comp24669_c0_seq25:3482-3688(-)